MEGSARGRGGGSRSFVRRNQEDQYNVIGMKTRPGETVENTRNL